MEGNAGGAPKAALTKDVVQAHLDRLFLSDGFVQSERLKRFLRYVVERTQVGDFDRLKETVIGVEVFGRPVGYDPKTDAIVRVEAYRLRQKLKQYYDGAGADEQVRFVFAKGSYIVAIEQREPPEPELPPAVEPAPAAAPPAKDGFAWVWAAAGGAAAMALILFFFFFRNGAPPLAPSAPVRLTLDTGWSGDPVLSPDGSYVVYSSDRGVDDHLSLWRVPVSRGEPVRVTPEPYDAVEADISPDGQTIAYRSRRADAPGLYTVPARGGPSRLLVLGGSHPRYSPDGRWLVYTVRNEQEWTPGKIYVLPTQGAAPQQLANNFADAHYALWSHDGKAILFCGTRISGLPEAEHDWWVLPFPNGQPVKTNVFPTLAAQPRAANRIPPNQYVEIPGSWSGGYVYYSSVPPTGSGAAIWRLPLPVENPQWHGRPSPERLTDGHALELSPQVRAGRMVFASGLYNVDLWSAPLGSGDMAGTPQRLVSHPAVDTFPAPAADGSHLAFVSDRNGYRQILVRRMSDQSERVLHESQYAQDFPAVSRDGRMVAFRESRRPKVPILVKALAAPAGADAAGGGVQTVCDDCGGPTDWSPDGRSLLFEPGATVAYIGRLDIAARRHEPLVTHPEHSLRGGRYSPDGRWVAFYEETGKDARRIWLAPADRATLPGEWTAVTQGRSVDVLPVWSPDGTMLYFLSDRDGHRCVYGLRIDLTAGKPVGEPVVVRHFHGARRSLLRLTRSRYEAVGLSILPDRMIFALDEQTSDLYVSKLP